MVLHNIPQLRINNIDLKILYTVGEGLCGVILGLTTKNNPTTYPLLTCKLFKISILCDKPNTNIYNNLKKYNITSKLIGIQNVSDKFEYEYTDFEGYKVKSVFNNIIHYYNIGGICNLTQYIHLLTEDEFKNIEYIKKYIRDILKNIKKINVETGILHHDLRTDNIMIKNNYSYYLFNLYNLYLKEQNENNKKKILKEINKYLFNKNTNKKLLDENLLKNNELYKLGLISITNNDITIIDFNRAYNLNDNFKKYIKPYNLNNKNVKQILQLIYNIWLNSDAISILFSLLEHISIINCNYKNNDNMKNIQIYIENIFDKLINEIIDNTILKELNNTQLAYIFLNIILTFTYNIKNNIDFDNVFNYIYTKQYLKNKEYLHYDYIYYGNLADKYINHNKINLSENDKKQVYKK